MLVVVAPPGFQAHVVPPEAVSVVLLPLQIVNEGEALIVGVGIGFTVTVFVSDAEHPPIVTVDEKAVVVVGLTVILDAVPPWLHAYETPAEAFAVSVVFCPLQIVKFPEIETVGVEFTVRKKAVLVVHPALEAVTV